MGKVHQRKPSRRHPTHAAPERCAPHSRSAVRSRLRLRQVPPSHPRPWDHTDDRPERYPAPLRAGKDPAGRRAHDKHRPPPSPAPTHLQHPLFETTSNLILKRSVTPSRDSTLGRGAGPAGAESSAGSAGRTASVPPRALRIVDLGAGDHGACSGNAGPAAALGRRAGRGPCDDVSLQRSSACATHCLGPGADDPAPFLLPFANPNGESG